MSFIKILKMKSDNFVRKYQVTNKLQNIFNTENIRLFAYVFVITRLYKIYLLYCEEIVLTDILQTLTKKQIEHIKIVKGLDSDKYTKFMEDNYLDFDLNFDDDSNAKNNLL